MFTKHPSARHTVSHAHRIRLTGKQPALDTVELSMNVDIWSDIACPWCYIGKRRFEKGLAGFDHRDEVAVTWHSFQLDPNLPEHYDGTGADYLIERKGMAADSLQEMHRHVAQQAAGEGLAYDLDHLVVANSMRGHQLLHLAKEHGVADQVKEGLLSAHFEQAKDIGDLQVLTEVGVAAGVDADEVSEMLSTGRYQDAVQADIAQAQSIGIQGVPFFVVGERYGVSGAQPPELILQALEKAWEETQPVVMVDSGDNGAACGPDGCAI